MSFFSKFISRKSPIREIERCVIDAIAESLPAQAGIIFRYQVASFNFIQRHSRDKEVNFYIRGLLGKVRVPTKLFINQREARLATVHLASNSAPIRVDAWIVNGHFFSLEFSASPLPAGRFLPKAIRVEIWTDPMRPPLLPTPMPDISNRLHGWVKEFALTHRSSGGFEPLSIGDQSKLVEQLRIELPSEYLQVISQTEGLQFNTWRILGLSSIRTIVRDSDTILVLVEFDEGGILGMRTDDKANLVFLSFTPREEVALPSSFREAVATTLHRLQNPQSR